jgi:hypothetical protein
LYSCDEKYNSYILSTTDSNTLISRRIESIIYFSRVKIDIILELIKNSDNFNNFSNFKIDDYNDILNGQDFLMLKKIIFIIKMVRYIIFEKIIFEDVYSYDKYRNMNLCYFIDNNINILLNLVLGRDTRNELTF